MDKAVRNRESVKRHYDSNKEYYINKNRVKRKKMDEYIRSLKEQAACLDCGKDYPHYVLEFDHARGVKKMNVSNASSWKSLYEELEKCDIVCANCHSARTWARRNV